MKLFSPLIKDDGQISSTVNHASDMKYLLTNYFGTPCYFCFCFHSYKLFSYFSVSGDLSKKIPTKKVVV